MMNQLVSTTALALAAALATATPFGLARAQDRHAQDRQAQNRQEQRFHDAGHGDDYLHFQLTSTKAGFITTNVDGRVRDFQLSYERDGEAVQNARIVFPVRAMTTDNGGRDDKMWGFCLDAEHHPDIEVAIPGPISVTTQGDVLGRIKIRGQWHPIPITLTARPGGGGTVVDGEAVVSFSRLGIPDPSIWIASVHDDIRIRFHMAVPTQRHAAR